VDPVPDPLLVRKSGSAGNRTRASGSVATNPDYYWSDVRITFLISLYAVVLNEIVSMDGGKRVAAKNVTKQRHKSLT
jgi:hypothetical protein